MTMFHLLESRRVACDLLCPRLPDARLCIVKGRILLCKMKKWKALPWERGHLFSKMEGRRQVNTTQPPTFPDQALAPSRVKCRLSIPQTHRVLSTSVPLGRLFSRLLILFPFSTNSKFRRDIAQILSLGLVNPTAQAPCSPTSSRLDFFPFTLCTKKDQCDMANSPARPISWTLSPPQTHTEHTSVCTSHRAQ